MMLSDANPPARKVQPSTFTLLHFFCLISALSCFALLNGCSTGNSAAMPASATTPTTPPQADSDSIKISGALPAATVGEHYDTTLNVSGGTGPYTLSLSWGALPPGLTLNKTTGTISGSPSKIGTYNFGVHAVDSDSNGGASAFQITVNDQGTVGVSVTPSTASVSSGGTQQFSASVTNTWNAAVTWSASSGTISSKGLYTAPTVKSDSSATITATSVADGKASATASVSITTSGSSSLSITTTSLPGATSGAAYSDILAATGGKAPYTWTETSGTLPSGISLQSSGSVSGTTTQSGQYTFSVEVTDSSSPEQTAAKSLTLSVSSATTGGTVSVSFFGADYNGNNPWPGTTGQGQAATLGGIRLWDDGLKWSEVNTASGVYDWTELDNWLGDAEATGQDVLYTFGATPQFATAGAPPGMCNSPGPYACMPPSDVNSDGTGTDAYWQSFVTALVTHAAGRIAFYELWNEPDCTCFWDGTEAQLVRMGADAAAIIRSLDPAAKILSPSAHGPTMATWFDGYIAAGGAPNFDIVNVHMRGQDGTNSNPLAFLTVYGQVQTELQKRNLTKLPLWDDEHGINPGQGLTDPDMLAGYASVSLLLRAGVGLQRQYIYTWDDAVPYGFQNNLSGTAWNVTASWLIGNSISACAPNSNGVVYTCALSNGLAVWDSSQTCSDGVCTTSNYAYPSGYAYYHDIAGNRYSLTGSTVPIGYQPILLANQ
jgi:Putative Ig domain